MALLLGFSVSLGQGISNAQSTVKYLGAVWGQPAEAEAGLPEFGVIFDHIVPGGKAKWPSVERPIINQYDWEIESVMERAAADSLQVRAHVLVWPKNLPDFLTVENAEEETKEWIFDFFARTGDSIQFIEVVNEISRTQSADGAGDRNPEIEWAWSGNNPEDAANWDRNDDLWVARLFRWAREAANRYNPDAKLYLNDYRILDNSGKRSRYLQIYETLQQAENDWNTPLVDAVGVQAHFFHNPASDRFAPGVTIDNFVTHGLDVLYAETGLPVHVTEWDIFQNNDADHLAQAQRDFPQFWDHPQVEGVSTWTVREGEDGNWGNGNQYLISDDLQPRETLRFILEYLREHPTDKGPYEERTNLPPLVNFSSENDFNPPATHPEYRWPLAVSPGETVTLRGYAFDVDSIDEDGNYTFDGNGNINNSVASINLSLVDSATQTVVYSDTRSSIPDFSGGSIYTWNVSTNGIQNGFYVFKLSATDDNGNVNEVLRPLAIGDWAPFVKFVRPFSNRRVEGYMDSPFVEIFARNHAVDIEFVELWLVDHSDNSETLLFTQDNRGPVSRDGHVWRIRNQLQDLPAGRYTLRARAGADKRPYSEWAELPFYVERSPVITTASSDLVAPANFSYVVQLSAENTDGSIVQSPRWELVGSSAPEGLTLSTSGLLSWETGAEGTTAPFTIRVEDVNGWSDFTTLLITVSGQPIFQDRFEREQM